MYCRAEGYGCLDRWLAFSISLCLILCPLISTVQDQALWFFYRFHSAYNRSNWDLVWGSQWAEGKNAYCAFFKFGAQWPGSWGIVNGYSAMLLEVPVEWVQTLHGALHGQSHPWMWHKLEDWCPKEQFSSFATNLCTAQMAQKRKSAAASHYRGVPSRCRAGIANFCVSSPSPLQM